MTHTRDKLVEQPFAETQKLILNAIINAGLLEEWRAYHRMLGLRDRITNWLADNRPATLSSIQGNLRGDFSPKAFDSLVRDGVIEAVFPDAGPGDSGRQFWDFVHLTALRTRTTGDSNADE